MKRMTSFRIDQSTHKMLKEIAEHSGVNMTTALETIVRSAYRKLFPERELEHDTPAKRLERVFGKGK